MLKTTNSQNTPASKNNFSLEQLHHNSLYPGTTAIIATCNSNPRLFAISLLSLLAHSSPASLDHVIVSINGPDSRTGDTNNQDIKQKFLEAIRLEKLQPTHLPPSASRDMPLTVQRTWSRVGHGEAIDAAIAWVSTQNYLLMHDDLLVLNDDWTLANEYLKIDDVGYCYGGMPHLMLGDMKRMSTTYNNKKLNGVTFPHASTTFIVIRKSKSHALRWAGLFAKTTDEFNPSLPQLPFNPDFLSYDIGSLLLNHLQQTGHQFIELPRETFYHYRSGSWGVEKTHLEHRDFIKHLNPAEEKVNIRIPHLFNIYTDFFENYTI